MPRQVFVELADFNGFKLYRLVQSKFLPRPPCFFKVILTCSRVIASELTLQPEINRVETFTWKQRYLGDKRHLGLTWTITHLIQEMYRKHGHFGDPRYPYPPRYLASHEQCLSYRFPILFTLRLPCHEESFRWSWTNTIIPTTKTAMANAATSGDAHVILILN